MRQFLRVVAASLMLVIGGLPVAGVLCARECTGQDAIATADASDHCHKSDAADTSTMSPVTPDGCSLIVLREVAMRERPASPVAAAPLLAVHVHVRDIDRTSHAAAAFAPDSRGKIDGVSPGALLPLRL
jgi:hypothetical protein